MQSAARLNSTPRGADCLRTRPYELTEADGYPLTTPRGHADDAKARQHHRPGRNFGNRATNGYRIEGHVLEADAGWVIVIQEAQSLEIAEAGQGIYVIATAHYNRC